MAVLLRNNDYNANNSVISSRRESGLSRVFENMTKLFTKNFARSADILFLKDLVVTKACDRAKRALQDEAPKSWLPITHDSIRLIDQAKAICEQRIYLDEAKELFSLISSKWLHAVLEIHDEVAAQIQNNTEEVEYIDGVSSIDYEDDEYDDEYNFDDTKRLIEDVKKHKESGTHTKNDDDVRVDTFRVIGIRRQPGEPIGLTVKVEEGRVTVARILSDSLIDRQGLLHTGDIIVEANGKRIRNPEELLKIFEGKLDTDSKKEMNQRTLNSINLDEELGPRDPYDVNEFITLKIEPAMNETQNFIIKPNEGKAEKHYIRALFTYDPKKDNLIPCQDIGLTFKAGDILEIVNWSDPSWWQARKVNYKDPPGLIPSQDLEERRKCFVPMEDDDYDQMYCCSAGNRRNKRHFDYFVSHNIDFDRAELLLYEPVEKMPPFSRKTLVLVSHPALSNKKAQLIHKIVDSNQDIFAEAKRTTTRPSKDEEKFVVITQEQMSEGLANNEFVEYEEDKDGHFTGTTFTAVAEVMKDNKLCLLDCKPEALKILHNSNEFLPYVVFLSPPSVHKIEVVDQGIKEGNGTIRRRSREIATEFAKYFDLALELENVDATYNQIQESLKKLATETQWVPRNWGHTDFPFFPNELHGNSPQTKRPGVNKFKMQIMRNK